MWPSRERATPKDMGVGAPAVTSSEVLRLIIFFITAFTLRFIVVTKVTNVYVSSRPVVLTPTVFQSPGEL